ncbi:DUF6233 domain-containing protein [Streptomyces sp. cg35]|uniref:DUF6233 domain-containing protein n=1 Tax=Streptomyces sp. cg35 TaxID=3421650 RepID=UPI003D16B659
MSETSPAARIDMLRFTRRVVEQQAMDQLAQIDRWIADEERRTVEQEQAARQRPPEPEWLIEMGLQGHRPVYVHVGGCHMAGKRSKPITADQARVALYDQVPPCSHCNPDTELGIIDV